MQFMVILNRGGGTLRTLDIETFAAGLKKTLEDAGHGVSTRIVGGEDLTPAIRETRESTCDVVMVGGGDGTISAAAGELMESGKALAVLPAGTMNLFARSLGIPLQLDAAVQAFASGEVRAVDLASANGRVFVHQFSVGMHAKLIKLRQKRDYNSKFGKMRASGQAALDTFLNPPNIKASLTMRGGEMTVKTAGIGITNNLFGEGHLPYADIPDSGVLGIYVTKARMRSELARFILNMAIGRWRANDQVDIYQAEEVTLKLGSRDKRFGGAIDGELCDLEAETVFRIHPQSLKVLVPATGTG